jgi:hypothetical protein
MAYFEVSRVADLAYVITAVPGLRIGTNDTLQFPLELRNRFAKVIDGVLEREFPEVLSSA